MEWIDITDNLPEKGKELLVWSDRYGLTFGTFMDENKHGTIWKYKDDPVVTFNAPTHWMYSPGKPSKHEKVNLRCPVCDGIGEHEFNCSLNKI